MNKISKFSLYLLVFISVERFCHFQTEGFRVHKILSDFPFNPNWETTSLENEEKKDVEEIMKQPFYYLGSGGQCYGFRSSDNKTVLKVFKQHHMRPEYWLNSFHLFGPLEAKRKRILFKREKRLNGILKSAKISNEELKNETGVIFAHLNKTSSLNKTLILYDNIGIKHVVDADNLMFLLQSKATLTYPTLSTLIKNNEIEKAKGCIHSLLHLLYSTSNKGFRDNDPRLTRNFGYVDEKAIEIDVGSFVKDPALLTSSAVHEDFKYKALPLKEWVKKNHPPLLNYVEEQLEMFTKKQ